MISEFLARSSDSINDEDGDRSDWIEIRNSSAEPIDLAGYALTDDPASPLKWVFPSRNLAGNAYLIVFASGKDRRDPDSELHTNFSLDGAGEYLALFAPNGLDAESEFNPFPPQLQDISFGESATSETSNVIATGAQCRWLVPTEAVNNWSGIPFDDSSWALANTGIAYERAADNTYTPFIGANGDVGTQMYQIRSSAYIRIPFTVTDADAVRTLTLRMKYDDGFAAFINGEFVESDRAPESLTWDSLATTHHDDGDALVFESFPINVPPTSLQGGQNVLAIQGLNRSTNSSDFLIIPELDISTHSIQPDSDGFHRLPTPGRGQHDLLRGRRRGHEILRRPRLLHPAVPGRDHH